MTKFANLLCSRSTKVIY